MWSAVASMAAKAAQRRRRVAVAGPRAREPRRAGRAGAQAVPRRSHGEGWGRLLPREGGCAGRLERRHCRARAAVEAAVSAASPWRATARGPSRRALPSRGYRGRRSSSLPAAPPPHPPFPPWTSSSRGSASPSRRPVGDADPRAAETRRRRWWRWWWCSERRVDEVRRQPSRCRHPRRYGWWRWTARRRTVRSPLRRRCQRRVPDRRQRLYAQRQLLAGHHGWWRWWARTVAVERAPWPGWSQQGEDRRWRRRWSRCPQQWCRGRSRRRHH